MLFDRVKCAVPNPGAVGVGSAITLGATPSGYRSFLEAAGAAQPSYFVLSDGAGKALTGIWTVNAGGTATITEILGNDRLGGTSGETFAGACVAWCTLPAQRVGWDRILRGSVVNAGALNLTFQPQFSLFRLSLWRLNITVTGSLVARCFTAGVPDVGATDYAYTASGGESTTNIQAAANASYIDLTGSMATGNTLNRITIHSLMPGDSTASFQLSAQYGGISSTPADRNLMVSARRLAAGAKSGIGLLPTAGAFTCEYLFEGMR